MLHSIHLLLNKQFFFFEFLVETGFYHINQAGLEFLTSGDPPTSASQDFLILSFLFIVKNECPLLLYVLSCYHSLAITFFFSLSHIVMDQGLFLFYLLIIMIFTVQLLQFRQQKSLQASSCGFLCPFDVIPLIFEHFVAFWNNKTSQVHLVLSLPQLWNQPRLKYYLESKIWGTDDIIFGHNDQAVCPTTLED